MGCLRAAAFALVLIAAPRALAQERLELAWDAPDSCPRGEAVVAEVTRLVGGTLPEGAPIHAEARATAVDTGGFTLSLRTEVEGVLGERALAADRCEELAAAAALILALMIDPEAVARAEPTEPSALTQPIVPSEPTPAETLAQPRIEASATEAPIAVETGDRELTEPDVPPTRPATTTGMIGAGAVLDVGTLPAPTVGVVIEGGFRIPELDARLRAVLLIPQTARGEASMVRYSADLWGLTAGIVGCYRPIDVFRELGICAAIEAGAVFGEAVGISNPRFDAGFWLGAGLGLDLAWRPEPWLDLEVMAEALGQIVAQEFWVTIDGVDQPLYLPDRITGRFGVAAHVHF